MFTLAQTWLQTDVQLNNRRSLKSKNTASCTTNKNSASDFWMVKFTTKHFSFSAAGKTKCAGIQVRLLGNRAGLG